MKTLFRALPPAVDFSIIVKEEIASQFAAPFHYHDGFECTFIVKGEGKFYGGNQVLNFREGDIYFFGPLFPHHFVNEKSFVQAKEPGHSIIVQFREHCLGKDFFQKPELKKINELLQLTGSSIKLNNPAPSLKKLFTQLVEQKGVNKILLFIQLLDCVASVPFEERNVMRLSNTHAGSLNNKFSKLNSVYRYVLENFKDDVSTKKAASLACLNESAFCRYFKRQTKKTFSQFVNEVRIIHATSLLRDKDLSMTDVCFESGFNNISYFNRQFKKHTGRSPLIYRKNEC